MDQHNSDSVDQVQETQDPAPVLTRPLVGTLDPPRDTICWGQPTTGQSRFALPLYGKEVN